MFRITHLHRLKNITSLIVQRSQLQTAKCLGLQRLQFNHPTRFYSKSKDGDDVDKKVQEIKDKACDPKKTKKPKIVLKECKPVNIQPCQPAPAIPPPRLPHINEEVCPEKQFESECPQAKKEPDPECPHDGGSNWDNYKNAALVGLLILASTLAALYGLGYFGEKKEKIENLVKQKKKVKRVPIKDPPSSSDIPNNVPYLLIGGGTASFAAFRAIKSSDPTAKVLVITNESFHPYMRPPLSKEMWFNEDEEAVKKLIFKQWNGTERHLYYEPEDFYIKCTELMKSENGGVAVARGYTISHLDVVNRTAYLDDGTPIEYGKCLIATGANPKVLNVFEAACGDPKVDEKVKIFRNIFDFEDIYDAFAESTTVAIVGGGFLGSELACALARKGKKKKHVYQIFREKGSMGKILPEYLSNWTTEKVKAEGVEVLTCSEVIGVKFENEKLVLVLSNGKNINVDHAILAVGVEANTQLAKKSDLEVDPELGGFLVNTELMARSNLYIAGDCACFYDAKLGRRRVEHHDHAVVTGRLAGENMTGGVKPYLHQSMFWSDLGPDVGFEAIGVVDSSLPTVGVFAKASDKDTPKAVVTETNEGLRSQTEEDCPEPKPKKASDGEIKEVKSEDYGKGVIFYLRDDIVVGIVLWNVFNRMSIARQVLKDERKYDDLNEVAKLFNIHEE